MVNLLFDVSLHKLKGDLDSKEILLKFTDCLQGLVDAEMVLTSLKVVDAATQQSLSVESSLVRKTTNDNQENISGWNRSSINVGSSNGDVVNVRASDNNTVTTIVPESENQVSETKEPITEKSQEVKQPILNGTITTLDVIDALSRIKEIGTWLDQARVIMEDVPKIRTEIKDLTENLLKVLQNGQNGSSTNGQ